jgi:glycosyltransferase involved in cell wall biosynthesis
MPGVTRAPPVADAPLRVLHVVGAMDRGGLETWLMHVLRGARQERMQLDFVTQLSRSGAYEPEILARRARIFRCPSVARPWRYVRELLQVLREHGPYDVVHSHVHHFSGLVLAVARWAGVPCRVAHSHNDTSRVDAASPWRRRLYLWAARASIRLHATAGLACAPGAARALFGEAWEGDARWQVLPCALDFSAFAQPPDRSSVRAELGLPPDAFVLGHVGRFAEQKNHALLLEVAARVLEQVPRARLLLVGEGPLRPMIEARSRSGALAGRVVLAGARADVARLMLGAMDVFVFPSHYEGLPLALVEAQAAGLPCVVSSAVGDEAVLVPELVTRLAPERGAGAWAERLVALAAATPPLARAQALTRVLASPLNIRTGIQALEHCYRQEAPR